MILLLISYRLLLLINYFAYKNFIRLRDIFLSSSNKLGLIYYTIEDFVVRTSMVRKKIVAEYLKLT